MTAKNAKTQPAVRTLDEMIAVLSKDVTVADQQLSIAAGSYERSLPAHLTMDTANAVHAHDALYTGAMYHVAGMAVADAKLPAEVINAGLSYTVEMGENVTSSGHYQFNDGKPNTFCKLTTSNPIIDTDAVTAAILKAYQ